MFRTEPRLRVKYFCSSDNVPGQENAVSITSATATRRTESACAPSGNANCATCALACPKAGGRKLSVPSSSHDFLFGSDFQVGGAGNDLLFGQPTLG
jgi:hypothetical protein